MRVVRWCRLTDSSDLDAFTAWSPDGEHIAFASYADKDNEEIYAMNAADASGRARLTEIPDNDHWPPT
jgi:Tol biopolymer transport system component